jgi:L-serine dehydratase
MESISVFDVLKIGVGPSSSHTLGPWRATQKFLRLLQEQNILKDVTAVKVDLYGSLSLTGKGHATDFAVMLGLSGEDPEYIQVSAIQSIIDSIKSSHSLKLNGEFAVQFDPETAIVFNRNFLPFHANGMTITASVGGKDVAETYYSVGGGFIVQENQQESEQSKRHIFPYPVFKATELIEHCVKTGKIISEIVMENEKSIRSEAEVNSELIRIWTTMLECMFAGCHQEGILPGGLNVKRRAFDLHQNLKSELTYSNPQEWLGVIRQTEVKFRQILKWVSCFALSVNEVNASLGRVVTAPTNGSAGVIPAVLMYYLVIENHEADEKHIRQFLLVAGELEVSSKKVQPLVPQWEAVRQR